MFNRSSAAIFVLILAMLLSGCQTAKKLVPPNLRPPSEAGDNALKLARERLQEATPCCSSLADFSYQHMLPWQPKKFELGPGSMVANLNGSQSYFLAFHLPDNVKLPYRIAVKSELNGRWLHASYLYAPTMVLVDAGFQPLRTEDIALCEHMGWGNHTTGAFGSLTVDDPNARYLLVYSSAAQQAGSTYWEQSPVSISTSSAATLKMASAGSFRVPHGPDGTLWVGMMNKTYAKAIANGICQKAKPGEGLLNSLPWSSKGGKSGSVSGSSP